MSESPWKSLTIGALGGVRECRALVEQAGFRVSREANYLLGKIPYARESAMIPLERVCVNELGLTRPAYYEEDILPRAKKRGLYPCPGEVAPALRLTYADQPYGERLWIGMQTLTGPDLKPVRDTDIDSGDPVTLNVTLGLILTVEHNSDGKCLYVRRSEHRFDLNDCFVFAKHAVPVASA